jgi:hypothetical protein
VDYIATDFLSLDELSGPIADPIRAFLGTDADGGWAELTRTHNDRAAALLAVSHALSRIELSQGEGSISGLEMTTGIRQLAGDRVYFVLDPAEFEAWRSAHGHFRITLPDKSTETGRVRFNRGGFGGSLHEGFNEQGITSNTKVPRMQWNYRECDALADIDIDGFHPWDAVQHLSYANSDVRQWWSKYVTKFGDPGFEVRKVGDVDPDKVPLDSECAQARDRVTTEEHERAVAVARRFESALNDTGDFRAALDAVSSRDTTDEWLAAPGLTPLQDIVSPAVLAGAPRRELHEYYTARAQVQWQQIERTDRAAAAASSLAAADQSAMALARPVETLDELSDARRRLQAAASLDAPADQPDRLSALRASVSAAPRVWLADNGTGDGRRRMIGVKLKDVQLILVPRGDDLIVTMGVPWR